MADKHDRTTSVPAPRRAQQRPGQPGAGERERGAPNPTSAPSEAPYPAYERDDGDHADAVARDAKRPSATK